MATRKHTHQYQRAILGKKGYVIYRCVLPDCDHYLPAELIVGKLNLCNRCKRAKHVIKADDHKVVLHKPHCDDCTRPSNNPLVRRKTKEVIAEETQPVAEPEVDELAKLASILTGNSGDV